MPHTFPDMNRIKEVLLAKQLTQIWLCEQLGKSYNMVNSYVQNRRQPSIPQLFEIARILNVEPKELLNEISISSKKKSGKKNQKAQ